MYILDKEAMAAVQGAGYWSTKCDFWGCYDEYTYDVEWSPGYWTAAEWVPVYDPFFGYSSVYVPSMWVEGSWVYY